MAAQQASLPEPRSVTSSWQLSWPVLAAAFAYLYLVGHGQMLLRDGDTFWHLAAGDWILANGVMPTVDVFSHTMRGAPWHAHEWLAELILALANRAGGWMFVVAACALAFAIAIGVLTRAMLRWLEPIYAVLFAALGVFMTAGHALARPHMLAMPLMVAWCMELAVARDENRLPRLWMYPLMAVWANLHGGFTLGLALAAGFGAEAVLAARKDKRTMRVAREWGLFLALATVASMLSPLGPSGIAFTWQILVQDSFALAYIGEWQSPNFHVFQPMELWLLAGMAVVLHQGLRLPPVRLLMLMGLVHLALKHARNVELLGVVAPLLVAAPFGVQWKQRQIFQEQFTVADRVFERLSRPAGQFALVGALALAVMLPAWLFRALPLEPPEGIAPVAAVQAARDARLAGPVLNAYSWGGYLIQQGIPVFIDGRADLYGDEFLKAYVRAIDHNPAFELPLLLDKHHVTWTVLPPVVPAVAVLDQLPGWRRVYADKIAVVHARIDPR